MNIKKKYKNTRSKWITMSSKQIKDNLLTSEEITKDQMKEAFLMKGMLLIILSENLPFRITHKM